jgi:hypothetical protein
MRDIRSSFGTELLCAASLIALVLPAFAGRMAMAEDGPLDLRLTQSAVWDSNPLMVTEGETEIYGSETSVTAGFSGDSPVAAYDASVRLTHGQFNESDFNSNDVRSRLGLARSTERWRVALNGVYDYITTRSSEITTFARTVESSRQEIYSASPELSYRVSARTTLSLNGSWREEHFEDDSLTDSRTISATPSVSYGITPRQRASAFFLAQKYEALEGTDRTVETIGPGLGWQYSINPSLVLALSVGAIGSTFEGFAGVGSDRQWDQTYSGTLTHTGEQNQASLSASRRRQSLSNGSNTILTTLAAQAIHNFTERLRLNANIRYEFSDQDSTDIDTIDEGIRGRLGLSYGIAEKWNVSASYEHKNETYTAREGDAKSDIFRIGVSFDPFARK